MAVAVGGVSIAWPRGAIRGRRRSMSEALFSLWHRLYNTRLRDALRGRFDASLDWRAIVAMAQLPAELANAVDVVVRRSRLWRSEKVDVAADLVGHFQDGLEAGRSPAELLQSFGDTKMAGQLIGRSKKRGRSLTWQLWHVGWMSAAVLLLAYIVTGIWMSIGRPSVTVDYLAKVNTTALSVPESERAWPIYRDAFLSIGTTFSKS